MSDCIYRQQALDAIRNIKAIIGTFDDEILLIDKAEAQTELMMLPSAEPELQWIPCSERLPKRDGEYLVTYEKGYAEDYGFDLVGITHFEVDCEGFGIWQEKFDLHTLGSLGSDWVDIPVIAWQKQPEPYRED